MAALCFVQLCDGPTNLDFSRSATFGVRAFNIEQTSCTFVTNEHDITNVSAPTEDVHLFQQ